MDIVELTTKLKLPVQYTEFLISIHKIAESRDEVLAKKWLAEIKDNVADIDNERELEKFNKILILQIERLVAIFTNATEMHEKITDDIISFFNENKNADTNN